MINLNRDNRDICCGCTACAESCPVNCINMKKDKMGFLYPDIDTEKCVNCGLCDRLCPGLKEKLSGNEPPLDAYAAIGLEPNVRFVSSSGGVFSLIAQYVISQNGIVFGATFDNDFHTLKHIAVDSVDNLSKLQGSKYVQSDMHSAYKETKKYLVQGRMVLFSGTPCQLAGLRSFLAEDYENLFLVDIVCHGVPAPDVWDEYLSYLEKKYHGKATKVSFRDKRKGWRNYVFNVTFDNGAEYTKPYADDLYMRGFLHDYYLRPSCHRCNYKGLNRISDITLGDLWGAEKIKPELDDNKGTSLVLISSPKGRLLFEKIASNIRYQQVNIKDALRYNPAIMKSAEIHSESIIFENAFRTQPVNRLLNKYCSRPLYRKIILKVKYMIKSFYKRVN